jgi:CheY-like chemotaxis protein
LIEETAKKPLILVIDDEEIVRDLTESTLEYFDYNSMSASSGEVGIALFSAHKEHIDAVVCDMVMPTLNGEEVFRKIREIDPKVIFLLSSGLEDPLLINKLKQQGLSGFLNKPYQPGRLIALLTELLGTC